MTDKIRVTFTDYTGAKHSDATLKASLTADEVVYLLVKNNFISESSDYRLLNKRTQRAVLPNQSLESAGILEGDMLIIEIPHVSDYARHSIKYLDTPEDQANFEFIQKYGSLSFDKVKYRNWWHSILRNFGKYPCYGIFLLLPSDVHLLSYLSEYGNELNILSSNCLIIAPSPHGVKNPAFQIDVWQNSVKVYVRDGYGRVFSGLFNIPFSSYPCFAIFNDFQSADYALVSLKEMNVQEISKKLRTVFSIIDKAALLKESPVKMIENSATAEKINNIGIHMITDIKSLAKTTLETLIETLIKASVP